MNSESTHVRQRTNPVQKRLRTHHGVRIIWNHGPANNVKRRDGKKDRNRMSRGTGVSPVLD